MFDVVKKNKGFATLWLAYTTSRLGDWFLLVALPVAVLRETGSATLAATLFVVQTLPQLLGPVGGALVDTFSQRSALIWANFLNALVVAALFMSGHAAGLETVAFGVLIVESVVNQVVFPATNAIIPTLVPPDALIAANSLITTTESLCRIVAPPLGAFFFVNAGLNATVVVDGASYALAAVILLRLPTPLIAGGVRSDRRGRVADLRQRLAVIPAHVANGLRIVIHERLLLGATLISLLGAAAQGAVAAILVPFVQVQLNGSARDVGYLVSAQALGGVAGGIFITTVGRNLGPLRCLRVSLTVASLLLAGVAACGSVHLVIPLLAAAGIPSVAAIIMVQVLVQTSTPPTALGSVSGAMGTAMAVGALVGTASAAGAIELFGVARAFAIGPTFLTLSAVAAWLMPEVSSGINVVRADHEGGAEAALGNSGT